MPVSRTAGAHGVVPAGASLGGLASPGRHRPRPRASASGRVAAHGLAQRWRPPTHSRGASEGSSFAAGVKGQRTPASKSRVT